MDPITGVDYRTEIEADITAQGFFPLDVGQATFAEGTLANPGTITDAGLRGKRRKSSGAHGFCLVHAG